MTSDHGKFDEPDAGSSDTNEERPYQWGIPSHEFDPQPEEDEKAEDGEVAYAEIEEAETLLKGRAHRRIEALYLAHGLLTKTAPPTSGGFVAAMLGNGGGGGVTGPVDTRNPFADQLMRIADYIVGDEASTDPYEEEGEEHEETPGILVFPVANTLVNVTLGSGGMPAIVRARKGEVDSNDYVPTFTPDEAPTKVEGGY